MKRAKRLLSRYVTRNSSKPITLLHRTTAMKGARHSSGVVEQRIEIGCIPYSLFRQ